MWEKMQHISITEFDIIHFMRNAGDNLAAETAVVEEIIRTIVLNGECVNSKTIILYLVAELKSTSEIIQLDVLRNALGIIVDRTPDDDVI